jgi:hypothetical protein
VNFPEWRRGLAGGFSDLRRRHKRRRDPGATSPHSPVSSPYPQLPNSKFFSESRLALRRARPRRRRFLSLAGGERKKPNAGRCIAGSGTAGSAAEAGCSIPGSRGDENARRLRSRTAGTAEFRSKAKLRVPWPCPLRLLTRIITPARSLRKGLSLRCRSSLNPARNRRSDASDFSRRDRFVRAGNESGLFRSQCMQTDGRTRKYDCRGRDGCDTLNAPMGINQS